MSTTTSSPKCPCGSHLSYADCCQPLHLGQPASSPEALMRSRYTGFVMELEDYLLSSWHPSTRPDQLELADSPVWLSLVILASEQQGDRGKVHFRAIYRAGNGFGFLEEQSDFVHEGGHWFYVAGDTREGEFKPGRNDRCPCGSGKKYKACCL